MAGGEGVKFATADHKGRYRLELQTNTVYEISVSYIGYQQQRFMLPADSALREHHFMLLPDVKQLDEIVIDYEYAPVEIKKDTITFRVDAFTSGNERKLKEVLEKLPGMEVDDNGQVRFQGNPVNMTMVENKKFFGGGSKLAVENVPADAVSEIEMISHFSEVDFMKEVLSSDELAMNIKLRHDKKNLLFGDLEGAGGPEAYHLAHSGLFYFSPKRRLSFIGDVNNIGKAVFTMDDILRFQGGVSTYLNDSHRPSFTNLAGFAVDNSDVVENESRFAALNVDSDISEKSNISGFGIFSNQLAKARSDEFINYLTNQAQTSEIRQSERQMDDLMALMNLKLDYSPNRYQKWYYNGQVQWSTNNRETLLNSVSDAQENNFETQVDNQDFSLKQYVEWHKAYSVEHTVTFVLNHTLDNLRPQTDWRNDQAFLSGFIPIVEDTQYHIQQVRRQSSNNVHALFKHYWILSRYGQLTSNAGNNYTDTELFFSDRQLLSDGGIRDFAVAGFGNDMTYKLNDAYIGLDYRFHHKKLTNTVSLYAHWYHLDVLQLEDAHRTVSRLMLEPNWISEYEFNTTEKLSLRYALRNAFPLVGQLNDRFTLSAYNAVSSGNALLENERYHTANFRYHKFAILSGTNINAHVALNRKVQAIRNELVFEGINQYRMPVMTENPETNVNAFFNYEKKIHWIRPSISANFGWFRYTQTVDQLAVDNIRKNQSLTLGLRMIEKGLPHVNVRYTKGQNQFRGATETRFDTDRINAKIDHGFLPSWTIEGSYDFFRNDNRSISNANIYRITNMALDYQEKNSAWGFRLTVNNLFDNRSKVNNSISDFLSSEQITYILPRVLLFGVRYKL